MDTGPLGLPSVIWGCFCLAIAILWVVVWPRDRVATAGRLRRIILRWFHALTWVLLALAAFANSLGNLGSTRAARPIALLSLLVYLVFLATWVTSKKGGIGSR